MNSNVIQSLIIKANSIALPLKQWEDDDFTKKMLQAERTLFSVGLLDLQGKLTIPIDLIEKIRDREEIQMTDCDSMSVGQGASKERSRDVNQRVAEMNRELKTLADVEGLNAEMKNLLGIQ